ncbi:hypothetical protein ABNQ39_22600 [Azospirillum sp. A26]|uniref:hypothetical protein n=1 Tax=Azospirillum sp. A26 TaxID=3160607 RepID=UPI00367105EB
MLCNHYCLRRLAIVCGCLSSVTLAGCDTPGDLRDYAKETTKALVMLDQEFQRSAADTARVNKARLAVQQRRAAELDRSEATLRDQIVIWDAAGEKEKVRRFNVLRGSTSSIPADLAPSRSPELELKPTPAIDAISATAKATDALSKAEPLYQRAKFLINYSKAVRDDVKKQEEARKAEQDAKPTAPKQ